MLRTFIACAVVVSVLVAGCSGADVEEEQVGSSADALTAYCKANVRGVGILDTETEYLPGVVHCENGGAPLEALKAQAVAARTYLYYKMQTSGSIANGQSDQVYSCGSPPTALQRQAVKETAGLVLRYDQQLIAAFYVAGGAASAPACRGASAPTEPYVTYNQGLSGTAVHQTSLGWISPTNDRNRGCMSQLGSRCLATAGKTYEQILRFYYGADIGLEKATGACVPTSAPTTPGAPPRADAGAPAPAPDAATPSPPGEASPTTPATPDDADETSKASEDDDDGPAGGQLGRRGVRRFDDQPASCSVSRGRVGGRHDDAGLEQLAVVALGFATSLLRRAARRRAREITS